MTRNYSDFDAQADEQVAPADAAPARRRGITVQAEAVALVVKADLQRFLSETLPLMTDEQVAMLAGHLPADVLGLDNAGQAYDANFSIKDELSLQIQAVQALRQHVFPGGKLKHDASVREAKEVATTCNQMLKTLMDSHERIMNMERMRAVEAAILDVLADLDDKIKTKFLDTLERKLAEIE